MENGNAFKINTGSKDNPTLPEAAVIDRALVMDSFARATGNQLRPHLAYVPRFAGSLAVGDVVLEPQLGTLRLERIMQDDQHVHLAWRDDDGPCRPSGRYATDQSFLVRSPGSRDRQLIQRQLAMAEWRKTDISGEAARLIAAHLHFGPRSAIYRFAINGAFEDDQIFDELEDLHANRQDYRHWVNALTRYLVGREHRGPMRGWVRRQDVTPEAAEPDDKPASLPAAPQPAATVDIDMVQQLIGEAFDLGVATARSRAQSSLAAKLTRARRGLIRQRIRQLPSDETGRTYWRSYCLGRMQGAARTSR